MSKPERVFPLSTVGGRIQARRNEKNMSRQELYIRVFGESATDPEGMKKTIYNWESGKTQLDYDGIMKICEVLECDPNFLFGVQDLPCKEYADISRFTGLPYAAAETLCIMAHSPESEILSELLFDRILLRKIYETATTDYDSPSYKGHSLMAPISPVEAEARRLDAQGEYEYRLMRLNGSVWRFVEEYRKRHCLPIYD